VVLKGQGYEADTCVQYLIILKCELSSDPIEHLKIIDNESNGHVTDDFVT